MILGRKREQRALERSFNQDSAQFITVYGRMRAGKTYLIQQFYAQKDCRVIHVTGIREANLKTQLDNFVTALTKAFPEVAPTKTPKRWRDAFRLMTRAIESTQEKVVLFLDELPWLTSKRSGLHRTLDYYWNNQWSFLRNFTLVISGSSVSWINKKIIFDTGGFHNRTTLELHLEPFELAETKEFLHEKGLSDSGILYYYLVLGGIPAYLQYIDPTLSRQENIQQLFFDKYAPLANEFDTLFDSLFPNADAYKEIVNALGKQNGSTRKNLLDNTTLSTRGGELSERLKKLTDMGIISEHLPLDKKIGTSYKVNDEFCLFYVRWLKDNRPESDLWTTTPTYTTWINNAFELICYKHIYQIMKALNTGSCRITSWRSKQATFDFIIISHRHNIIILTEIVYAERPLIIDKSYAKQLDNYLTIFEDRAKPDKPVQLALIAPHGFKRSMYSEELIKGVVTQKDLFKKYEHL